MVSIIGASCQTVAGGESLRLALTPPRRGGSIIRGISLAWRWIGYREWRERSCQWAMRLRGLLGRIHA
jgi:hypothetical protein